MNNNEYKIYLKPLDVWALSLGCIIGWGAFAMPGTTFLPVAGPLGTVAAVCVGSLIMLVIGFNFAYLMHAQPGIGGSYAYTKEAFGRDHAFLSSWFLCLAYLPLIPQNVTSLSIMVRFLFGEALSDSMSYEFLGQTVFYWEVLLAIVILIGVAVLAIFCKELLHHIQTLLGILLMVGVFVLSLMVLPKVSWETLTTAFSPQRPVQGFFSIVILSPWAFVGFEVVALETAHYRFHVKWAALLIALAILMGGYIYITMTILAFGMVPEGYPTWASYVEYLNASGRSASEAVFVSARSLLGEEHFWIMVVTFLSAILSSVIGFYRASVRILSNMAYDKILGHEFERPRFCFLFVMLVSVLLSLFGRSMLARVVDLSSFGAMVAFGYTSGSAYRLAKSRGNQAMKLFGQIGAVASIIFGLVQLIPKVTVVETMDAESYLFLAFWCLLGFAFYWRTMINNSSMGLGSEHVTILSLFSLLFYSSVIWYLKTVLREEKMEDLRRVANTNAITLLIVVVLGLVVMLAIYTMLRKRQVELESERIRALEGSRAKSTFLFNMSHDIRTPMNAIMGFTHLGMNPELSAAEKDVFFQKIDNSGHHLLGIINDVLDMSRIENDKVELEPCLTDLRLVFNELQDIFTGQMLEKEITFTVDVSQVENPWVLCDKNRFSRVVLNLLSNAYKFTPRGGSVELSLQQISPSGEEGCATYELRVKDSGIGMSQEFTEHLFKPFERERTSTVSGIQGTGLGMSITKGIVELMGGSIQVDTAPGKGTEFIIRLELPLAEEPQEKREEEAQEELDLSRLRVLLVEDNEINMEIATMILEQTGMSIEQAENGQVAVDKVSASAPGYYDLVLMDIQMPVMDGYTAAKAIRALPERALSQVPIIAMTANAFSEDVQTALEAGMQDHIAKPIDVEAMMNTLKRVLKNR